MLALLGAQLHHVFLDCNRPWRRVGRALIAKYGRLCLNLGYGGLHWRVLDANEAGIGFYQAIGAEVSTEHRNCGLSGPALQALVEAAAPIERVLS